MMINCEVCGQILTQSGNAEIYTCTSSFQWIEEYNRYIEFKHFTCHMKDNKILYKTINLYPYRFDIFYSDNTLRISKSITRSKINNNGMNTAYSSDRKVILELNTIVEFPWHDKDQVLNKLKLYSVFS